MELMTVKKSISANFLIRVLLYLLCTYRITPVNILFRIIKIALTSVRLLAVAEVEP